MTQEEKDLLLRDLCGRLSYGVKIKTSYDKMNEPIELRFINPKNESFAIGSDFTLISGLDFDTYECKPYLFPLSNMTEEQINNCPIGETNLNIIKSNTGYGIIEIPWQLSYIFVEWCNKNHFDYRGLIPMGLAIDCTNLNIY